MIAVEMGSEGWSVFGGTKEVNDKIIENYKVIASNLSEKEAKLLASAPDMHQLLKDLKKWERYVGGWESPVWDRVEQLLEELS